MNGQLRFDPGLRRAIWRHLLPVPSGPEQAAFGFAFAGGASSRVLQCRDWMPVLPSGFQSRSQVHFELDPDLQAEVIKRAHDMGASLVEFHSHTGPYPAEFSVSDLLGFREFVPHVMWRLKNRPYAALVVTRTGFDGFLWESGTAAPVNLEAIEEDDAVIRATGLSVWRQHGFTQ